MLWSPVVLNEVDPRGPVINVSQGRPVVGPGRVEIKGFHADFARLPQMPDKGTWIWLNREAFPDAHPTAALFRKEFDLPLRPRSARVWYSADSHVRIYVNGRLAARGPDDGGQDYPGTQTEKWFVNYRDLSPFFKKGRNVVAAEVFTADAMEGRYNTTGKGGLLFASSFSFPNSKSLNLKSDSSWRGREGREWKFAEWRTASTEKGVSALQFDAKSEEQSWRSAGFDDSSWPGCSPAVTVWPSLVLSEIPPRMEATYPWTGLERTSPGVTQEGRRIEFQTDGSCSV